MLYIWLAALVLFTILEAATVNLVSVWFAVGSLAALIAAVCGGPLWLQIALFLAVSGAVLAFVRPLAKKLVSTRRRPTNADRVIGRVCTVTEDVDNIAGRGAVFVDGKTWTARSAGGAPIPKGTLVRPLAIEGVKLMVAPVTEPAAADKT